MKLVPKIVLIDSRFIEQLDAEVARFKANVSDLGPAAASNGWTHEAVLMGLFVGQVLDGCEIVGDEVHRSGAA